MSCRELSVDYLTAGRNIAHQRKEIINAMPRVAVSSYMWLVVSIMCDLLVHSVCVAKRERSLAVATSVLHAHNVTPVHLVSSLLNRQTAIVWDVCVVYTGTGPLPA